MAQEDDGSILLVHSDSALRTHISSLGYPINVASTEQPVSLADPPPSAILFALRAGESSDLRRIAEWATTYPDVDIVAIVEGDNPDLGSKALSTGAACWLPRSAAQTETLSNVIDRAIAHRRSRIALQKEQQRYRNLVELAPIGVFEVKNGRLTYVNEYLIGVSGYSQNELLGIRVEELIVEEDRDRALEALQARGRDVEQSSPNVYGFVGKHGQVYVGEVRSRFVESSTGFRIEGTVRDITHETRLMELHRVVLELGEVILGEQDIDRILQLV